MHSGICGGSNTLGIDCSTMIGAASLWEEIGFPRAHPSQGIAHVSSSWQEVLPSMS